LKLLVIVPITSELISTSKIGKAINRFLKEKILPAPLHIQTENLVQKWKEIVNRDKKKRAESGKMI
jgi:hypothetical protein